MVNKRHLLETFTRSNYNRISASESSTDDMRHILDRCFFSHQCAEKALKVALVAENKKYLWTHDLNLLFRKLSENWNINRSYNDLERLSRMYINSKYDFNHLQITPSKADADWAFSLACEIFENVKDGLRTRSILCDVASSNG